MDSNHRSQRQQIYSLPPLAARESHRMERVKGIEPSQSAWKADVLPLNYTRKWYGAEYTALFANVKPYSSFFFTFSEFFPHDRKLVSQKTKVRHSHRRKKSPPKGGADAQNPLGQSMTPAKTERDPHKNQDESLPVPKEKKFSPAVASDAEWSAPAEAQAEGSDGSSGETSQNPEDDSVPTAPIPDALSRPFHSRQTPPGEDDPDSPPTSRRTPPSLPSHLRSDNPCRSLPTESLFRRTP